MEPSIKRISCILHQFIPGTNKCELIPEINAWSMLFNLFRFKDIFPLLNLRILVTFIIARQPIATIICKC